MFVLLLQGCNIQLFHCTIFDIPMVKNEIMVLFVLYQYMINKPYITDYNIIINITKV